MGNWMRLVLAVALTVISGCPTGKTRDVPERCTAFGQSCLFAPGKLGTCVIRDGCTGPNCLVCQSQH